MPPRVGAPQQADQLGDTADSPIDQKAESCSEGDGDHNQPPIRLPNAKHYRVINRERNRDKRQPQRYPVGRFHSLPPSFLGFGFGFTFTIRFIFASNRALSSSHSSWRAVSTNFRCCSVVFVFEDVTDGHYLVFVDCESDHK